MYCRKCGAFLPDGWNYCTRCGEKATEGESGGEKQQSEYTGGANGGGSNAPVKFYTFQEAIVSYFTNYCKFDGRATRAEYWWIVLFNACILTAINLLALNPFMILASIVLNWAYFAAVLLPTLGLIWRRLHDIGKSGVYFLFILIPLAGAIILIVFYCIASDGDNMYGKRKTV